MTQRIGAPQWERLLYVGGCAVVKTKQKKAGIVSLCRQQREENKRTREHGAARGDGTRSAHEVSRQLAWTLQDNIPNLEEFFPSVDTSGLQEY